MKRKIAALTMCGMMLLGTVGNAAVNISLKEYDDTYTPKGGSQTVVYSVENDRLEIEGTADTESVYLFINEDFKPVDLYDYPDLFDKWGIKLEVVDGKFSYKAPEPTFPLPIEQGQLKYNTENQLSQRLVYNTYPNRFFAASIAEDGTIETTGVIFVVSNYSWTNI